MTVILWIYIAKTHLHSLFQLLVSKRARVPLGDGFLARRISGPGLAGAYFYQIRTEQALFALETKMELDQLRAYKVSSYSRLLCLCVSCQIKVSSRSWFGSTVTRFHKFIGWARTSNTETTGRLSNVCDSNVWAVRDDCWEKVKLYYTNV